MIAKAGSAGKQRTRGFMSLFRSLVRRQLSKIRHGMLTVEEGEGVDEFGALPGFRAKLRINHSRFYRQAVLGGRLSIAESYLNGDWDCDDLTSLFRLFIQNDGGARQFDGGIARVMEMSHRIYHWCRKNTRTGSRKNIAAHYDLGNDFYRLWLDPTMAYSSGIFGSEKDGMEEASIEKFDRVCRKLDLSPADHLLEIGTGWGGFAVHAAGRYGCQVTTSTISSQQFEISRERIDEAGLSDRIQLLSDDYRDLKGQYDKLVSIEMIEAVGYRFFDQFFANCGQLLKPDGTMVIQAIVMPEQRYAAYLKSVDFIQRFVFPGGCLPSVGAMLESAGRTTDLRVVHVEDFAPHYAETIRRWRKSFQENLGQVRELGYPESFIRLWNYYLCYCEAAFEERCVGVVQVTFDKPGCRRDPLLVGQRAAEMKGLSPRWQNEVEASKGVLSDA